MAQKKLKTAQEYFSRGFKYSEAGKLDLALADYEAGLKLDSLECDIYNNIAGVFTQKKKFDIAIQNYSKAIQCAKSMRNDQKASIFTLNRALCKHEMGDYQEAIKDYSLLVEVDSTTLTSISLELLYLKKYDDAIQNAKKVLNLSKLTEDDKASVALYSAYALMFKGDIDKALEIHKANQDYQFNYATWKEYVKQEFANFRKAGLPTENMSKVESLLGIAQAK